MGDAVAYAGTPLGDYLADVGFEEDVVAAPQQPTATEPVMPLLDSAPGSTPRSWCDDLIERLQQGNLSLTEDRATTSTQARLKRRRRELALGRLQQRVPATVGHLAVHALVAVGAALLETQLWPLALLVALVAAYLALSRAWAFDATWLVDELEDRVLALALLEQSVATAVRLVAENEMAANGFRVSTSVASVARLDRRDRQRRLLALREALDAATANLSAHITTAAAAIDGTAALASSSLARALSTVVGQDETDDAFSLLALRGAFLRATAQRATLARMLAAGSVPPLLSAMQAARQLLPLRPLDEARRRLDACMRAARMPAHRVPTTESPAEHALALRRRALNASLLSTAWRFQAFADASESNSGTAALREEVAAARAGLDDASRLCELVLADCDAVDAGQRERTSAPARAVREGESVAAPRETAGELAVENEGAVDRADDHADDVLPVGEEVVFEGEPSLSNWRATRGPLLPREERIRLRREQMAAEEEAAARAFTGVQLISELHQVLLAQNKWKPVDPPARPIANPL